MKILIINGYPESREGFKAFLGFRYLIQKIFMEQTIIIDMDTEFLIRKINELDDLLYESTSTSIKTSSGRNFDSFDMIFIAGHPNLRPWSKQNQNIQILVRMCLRAHKFLFASSFAMETLIYQSATNFDRTVNIINGDEGGRLTEMTTFSKQIQNLSSMDFFLENSTGDLYQFSNDKQEWKTKTNTGFHNTLAAQTYSTIGKFLIKAPVYRTKNNLEGPNQQNSTYISKNTECICYIKKQYILHWAFQDMPGTNFLVQKKGKWDIHPFSFTNSETTFVTLAESDSGPLIVCYGDFIMGCQFEIVPKYFESLIPMKNFIYNKLLMISENKQSKVSILNINATISQADILRDMRFRAENNNQRSLNFDKISSSQKPQTPSKQNPNRTFRNSGFAATKKNIGIIVTENAVGQNVIKQSDSSYIIKQKGKSMHQENASKVLQDYKDKVNLENNSRVSQHQKDKMSLETNSRVLKEYQDKATHENNRILSSSQLTFRSSQNIRGSSVQVQGKQEENTNNLPSFEQLLQARLQELGLGDEEELLEEEEPITKEQVRRYLHPFLNKDSLFEHASWVPGQLKDRERKPAIRVKQDELFKGHFHKVMKDQSQNTSKMSFGRSSSVLMRNGSQQSITTTNNRTGQQSLMQSSIFVGDPYKSQDDIRREFTQKESLKNIGPKSFTVSVKKSRIHPEIDPDFIQNYVQLSPSKTRANNHQYREISKNNWVSNQNFLLIV